jgi:hypothetical protein
MAGKSPGYPQAQGPVGYAFLSRKEVSLLRRLIHDRRSLPIYRVDGWLCYECAFACPELAAMVRHILCAHGAVPADEEDRDEDDRDHSGSPGASGTSSAQKIWRRGRAAVNGRANPAYMPVTKSYSVSFTKRPL